MLTKQIIELYDLLDRPDASGEKTAAYLKSRGAVDVTVRRIAGNAGSTDFIRVRLPGANGRSSGGTAPTLGVIGRLGGLGARPERIGFVSDGDGALAALAVAAKAAEMAVYGDRLPGDLIVCTHVCPDAPTLPHAPVPFMDSPVDMAAMNRFEVLDEMEAILSIDTTKGNRIINHCGIAISPTVKEGYILPVSEDLLELLQYVTGMRPFTFPLSMQDITPYGNGLYHLNSILQPSTATAAPVVGVAITAEATVPGCATGATQLAHVESAARFALEAAKAFGGGGCAFYNRDAFSLLRRKYGPMTALQGFGLE